MREEMNHLIEYYSVLHKAGSTIFGEDLQEEKKRLSISINAADQPEQYILRSNARDGNDSDNSDDQLFKNYDCKQALQNLSVITSLYTIASSSIPKQLDGGTRCFDCLYCGNNQCHGTTVIRKTDIQSLSWQSIVTFPRTKLPVERFRWRRKDEDRLCPCIPGRSPPT